jgi:hypothetical protein
MLEVLEDRSLLSGDLLLTAQVPGASTYNLREYTPDGAIVSSQPVPPVPGSTDLPEARGLSVDPSGNVNLFDGTFMPGLATLSATSGTWSFQTFPGWSTVNNISYSEVAAYNNFVFASDMTTFNIGGEPNGIIRFDSSGGPTVRFGNGTDYLQVALGIDGLLYGLEGGGNVHVFDPDTLAPVRTFSLKGGPDGDIRSIAVDNTGQVIAATWGGYLAEYDPNGNYLTSIQLKNSSGFGENLINVALDTDGQVAVGGRFGEAYLTDESLASVKTIQTNQWVVFVTFNHYIGTNPILATPSFDSLAGPTITFGQSSVTLSGRITGGTAIPTGSVSITVGGVTQQAAINPVDGTFSANFDTSTLSVADSPLTITYSYPGDKHDNPIQDTSQSLTVNQAVTSLSNLASPTVVAGTQSVDLTGTVGSNSVLPVGQAVTVTITDANGNVVGTASGVINNDGSFTITIDTSALSVGSYSLQYVYAGDVNFTESDGLGTLTVTF